MEFSENLSVIFRGSKKFFVHSYLEYILNDAILSKEDFYELSHYLQNSINKTDPEEVRFFIPQGEFLLTDVPLFKVAQSFDVSFYREGIVDTAVFSLSVTKRIPVKYIRDKIKMLGGNKMYEGLKESQDSKKCHGCGGKGWVAPSAGVAVSCPVCSGTGQALSTHISQSENSSKPTSLGKEGSTLLHS